MNNMGNERRQKLHSAVIIWLFLKRGTLPDGLCIWYHGVGEESRLEAGGMRGTKYSVLGNQ